MNENELKERTNTCLNKKLPVPCASGCPCVCCDPIIITTFVPRKLLFEQGLPNLKAEINSYIDNFISTKDMTGGSCFKFEGLLFTEMNDSSQFTDDNSLIRIYRENTNKQEITPEKLAELKKVFQSLHIGAILLFSCSNYNPISKGCSAYEIRPLFCRSFICEQLEPELLGNNYEKIYTLIKNKAYNLDYLKNNYYKSIDDAVKVFISRK